MSTARSKKAYKDRGRMDGRCRDCPNPATFASYCDRCTKRRRIATRRYREKMRAERGPVEVKIPRYSPQRLPSIAGWISSPFAKTIPDDHAGLYAACRWLAP